MSLMKMAAVEGDLAVKGYQRLCAESGKDVEKLCVDDVVKTFCDESAPTEVVFRNPSSAKGSKRSCSRRNPRFFEYL